MEKDFFCANSVSFSYYRSPLFLNNVSFSMQEYDKVLLLASSGMGKTTFLAVMSTFESNYFGKIIYDGKELKTISDDKKQFSFLPTNPVLFDKKSIAENINFVKKIDENELQILLKKYNLIEDTSQKTKKLSLLNKRKLALIRSEIKQPKILFLDDQFSNLSDDEKQEMFEYYKNIISNPKLSVIFALDSANYRLFVVLLKTMKISKILYLINSNLFEFSNLDSFESVIKNINQMQFFDEYSFQNKAILYRENDKYFIVFENENFEKKFELTSDFDGELQKLNLANGDEEDIIILSKDNPKFDELSADFLNENILNKSYMIFSNIDGSKIL